MKRCNVEFFDTKLNNVHHDTVRIDSIDDDYLAPEISSIEINKTDSIPDFGFVRIVGDFEFFGLITSVDDGEYLTTVNFKPFVSFFAQEVLFDVDDQTNGSSIELVIANLINRYWMNSVDDVQNLPIINISVTSSTTGWNLGIESALDDSHYAIVDFYDDVIAEACRKYGVTIKAYPNYTLKTIDIFVGGSDQSLLIEADLPSVEIETFTIHEASDTVNKLEIWNSEGFNEVIYFYLHTDDTYDTVDTDRVSPVVRKVDYYPRDSKGSPHSYEIEDDPSAQTYKIYFDANGGEEPPDTIDKSKNVTAYLPTTVPIKPGEFGNGYEFQSWNTVSDGSGTSYAPGSAYTLNKSTRLYAQWKISEAEYIAGAWSIADDIFSGIEWNNLIELRVLNDDSLIRPQELELGQLVVIKHDDVLYPSILTGLRFEDTITLSFGTIRLDLTKQLKTR